MEMKVGYKQTDVGMIPEDWDCSRLGDFAFITKLAGFEYTLYFDYSQSGPVIAIRALNIKDGRLDLEAVHTIPKKTADMLPRSKLAKGDLVISYVGTLGRVAVIPEDDRFHLAPNVAKISVDKKHVDPGFLGQYLNSFRGQKLIFEAAASTTQAALSMANLRQVCFARPSLPEQRTIAGALSDMDVLIGSLDQLIAKKRDLKQAAMQELLTGKRRLPGFQGEWEVKRMGEVGNCLRGVTYKGDSDLLPYDTKYTIRLLRSNNVQNAIVVFTDIQFVNAGRVSDYQILRKNDILICMANGSKALVGKAGLFEVRDGYDYTFGAFMGCFRSKTAESSPAFVYFLFQTGRYRNYINNLLAGSSINNLNPNGIESIEFPFPRLPEQTAIAEVLSDMDSEIAVLELRRDKTRDLKQGMMQELLTGRTRLV